MIGKRCGVGSRADRTTADRANDIARTQPRGAESGSVALRLDDQPGDAAIFGARGEGDPRLERGGRHFAIGADAASANGEMSPAALKAGVAFAPRTENGRVTGLVVQPQGDGAAFRAAGLRPGDVIRGVNGRPIGSAGDAAALANQITPGARLSLEVERGANVVPIAIFVSK